jgi:hypothetical protein
MTSLGADCQWACVHSHQACAPAAAAVAIILPCPAESAPGCCCPSLLHAAGGAQAEGLAVAIATVSCQGGASAEAFSRALSQSIQKDPTTGCDVLVKATTFAFASCGPTGAFSEAGSSVSRVSYSRLIVWLSRCALSAKPWHCQWQHVP